MLEDEDFPLIAQGNRIYSTTQSSPLAMCRDHAMAVDLVRRLNEAHVKPPIEKS